MKTARESFIFLIFSSLLLSCTKSDQQYSEIQQYFQEKHQFSVDENIDAIFVLTARGCVPCNQKFSYFMLSNKNNKQSIYLIKAPKNRIDLSAYKNYKGVVFYDTNYKENIFDSSKVIFLNNKKVDTIVQIEALTLEKSFTYIKERLK
ncbi:MAG: hypothetical protein AB7D46_05135 [Flavobacteriaceae bacterium]